jgi:hypothetical protein
MVALGIGSGEWRLGVSGGGQVEEQPWQAGGFNRLNRLPAPKFRARFASRQDKSAELVLMLEPHSNRDQTYFFRDREVAETSGFVAFRAFANLGWSESCGSGVGDSCYAELPSADELAL